MTRLRGSVLIAALALAAGPTFADSLRCGPHLVRVGDLKPDVLAKCGEPEIKEVVSGADERRVEQWVYRPGEFRFARVLTFKGLRVTRIETLVRN